MTRAAITILALLALSGCVHTLVASGAVIAASEVLPPVNAALGIVIDIPKVRDEIQGWVDPRALELPPEPGKDVAP